MTTPNTDNRFDYLELDGGPTRAPSAPLADIPAPAPAPLPSVPVPVAPRGEYRRLERGSDVWCLAVTPGHQAGDRVIGVRGDGRMTACYLIDPQRTDGGRVLWTFQTSPAMRDAPVMPSAPAAVTPLPVRASSACGCAPQTRPLAINGRCPACQGTVALPANFGSVRTVTAENAPSAAPRLTDTETRTARAATLDTLIGGQGTGLQIGWAGAGERTRGALATAISGLAPLPAAKKAALQASHAVRHVAGTEYTVTVTSAGGRSVDQRGWSAQWTIASKTKATTIGAASGSVLLTVTVDANQQLVTEGSDDLGRQVRAEFERRCAGEIYSAAEITAWLQSHLYALGAVKFTGLGWYVSPAVRVAAEPLYLAIKGMWGAWGVMPIATTAEVLANLSSALIGEATDIIADLAKQRTAARDAGKTDITPRAAGTVLASLRKVAERTLQLGALLGGENVAVVRGEILAAIETVLPLLDDTSQRGVLIWDEIASDSKAVAS